MKEKWSPSAEGGRLAASVCPMSWSKACFCPEVLSWNAFVCNKNILWCFSAAKNIFIKVFVFVFVFPVEDGDGLEGFGWFLHGRSPFAG